MSAGQTLGPALVEASIRLYHTGDYPGGKHAGSDVQVTRCQLVEVVDRPRRDANTPAARVAILTIDEGPRKGQTVMVMAEHCRALTERARELLGRADA